MNVFYPLQYLKGAILLRLSVEEQALGACDSFFNGFELTSAVLVPRGAASSVAAIGVMRNFLVTSAAPLANIA